MVAAWLVAGVAVLVWVGIFAGFVCFVLPGVLGGSTSWER